LLASFTFIFWALPALIIMTLVGLFFNFFNQSIILIQLLEVLPSIAVGFIVYAGWSLSKRVMKKTYYWWFYGLSFLAGLLLIPISYFAVPIILLTSGFFLLVIEKPIFEGKKPNVKPRWNILILIVLIAVGLELVNVWISEPLFNLMNSFFRYGYSVIGGGQIVIPLMIQDLVTTQALITLETFLSGYAIDQAIPGPLFSFSAFVGTQSLHDSFLPWLGGFISGITIFIPGILLVYFVVPIWRSLREFNWLKNVLTGITIAAASLIVLTAVTQITTLPSTWFSIGLVGLTFALLQIKKIPTPLLVGCLILLGGLVQSIN